MPRSRLPRRDREGGGAVVRRGWVRLARFTNERGWQLSIVVRFHPTNVDREKYEASVRLLEEAGLWPDPDGLELHVAFGAEDDLRVSEIWASREQFQAFGERLMPILSDIGIQFSGEPEVFEVHNLVKS